MRNNKIKAVVVGGWIDNSHFGRSGMIQLIGAFENVTEAYGQAYRYLDEICTHDESITPTMELEGDTGYAIYTKNKEGLFTNYAYILLNSESEQESKNETEE